MKNELLTIGPFTIYGYGLMIAIGILAAYFTGEYRAKKKKMEYNQVFYIVLWCVAGGFVGAKILYWLTEWRTILKDPGFLLDSLTDGFVVLGGILGGILTAYIYCHIKKMDFLRYFDLLIPSVALAQGFGRLGCLLAGCCYGKETASHLAITFTNSDFAPNHVPLVPTQIYASVLDFAHYFVLILAAKHLKGKGQVAAAVSDPLQCGTFYPGILQRRSGKGKCRYFIYLSVYFDFYVLCRASVVFVRGCT